MRFIPVPTGNTIQARLPLHQMPVYPRTYGEHSCLFCGLAFELGLSPYLRGTPILKILKKE